MTDDLRALAERVVGNASTHPAPALDASLWKARLDLARGVLTLLTSLEAVERERDEIREAHSSGVLELARQVDAAEQQAEKAEAALVLVVKALEPLRYRRGLTPAEYARLREVRAVLLEGREGKPS